MNFSLSPHEEASRDELRAWLATNLPEHRTVYPPSDDELSLHPDKSFDACRVWHKRLHAGGWMGVQWPRQYGGRGAGLVERLLYIAGRVLRLTNLRYMTRALRGEAPGAEGSVLKLTFTGAYKEMAEIATQILGPYHQIWGDHPRAPEAGRWAFQALFANRFGIAGGTDQIQRSIIGERLLGLPK